MSVIRPDKTDVFETATQLQPLPLTGELNPLWVSESLSEAIIPALSINGIHGGKRITWVACE
jgi:hypothetical protein